MQDREEVVGVSLHPRVARGEHQAGDADREEEQQRQHVEPELLHGDRAAVDHPAAERQHHASDDEKRRPDETMEDDERGERVDREVGDRQAEHVRP